MTLKKKKAFPSKSAQEDFLTSDGSEIKPEFLDPTTEKEIHDAVETILGSEDTEQIQSTFYRNIDPSQEFGVSRFVADRIYYLPKLMESIKLSSIQDS